MPIDRDTAIFLHVSLAELVDHHKNGLLGISPPALERAERALALAAAEDEPFNPTSVGLHGLVTDFGMSIQLAYVVSDKVDGRVQILRDREHFRRMGMQRDNALTTVAKLRRLADWIEEHTA